MDEPKLYTDEDMIKLEHRIRLADQKNRELEETIALFDSDAVESFQDGRYTDSVCSTSTTVMSVTLKSLM